MAGRGFNRGLQSPGQAETNDLLRTLVVEQQKVQEILIHLTAQIAESNTQLRRLVACASTEETS